MAIPLRCCHTSDMEGGGRIQVFISYAHEDRRHLEQLLKHVAELERGKMTAFHDAAILPGQRWESTIRRKLDTADVVVFLVSANFIASDFCQGVEFEGALAREKGGCCRIIPVNLGPVDLSLDHPLQTLQHVPKGKAIYELRSKASAWKQVSRALRTCIEGMQDRESSQTTGEASGQLPQNVIFMAERREAASPGMLQDGRVSRSRHLRPLANRDKNKNVRPPAGDGPPLTEVLRDTSFDGSDWQSLALSTRQLREALLDAARPASMSSARAQELAQALQRTLTPVLSPSASPSSIQAACISCERLRAWLLDILTSSGV